MKAQSAKSKGRKEQQAIRDAILLANPELEPADIRSTSMGASGEDLLFSPAAHKLFPYDVEVKHHAKFAVYGIYDQARGHGTKEPVAFIRQNNRKALAVVDARHFIELVRKANAN